MALTKSLGGGGGGGSGTVTTVKDEGTNLSTAVTSIDFVGAGVTATGTTAVTVTIPGGSGAQTLISEQTPSGTGTVTFSSISSSYRDLRVVVRGRGSQSAAATNVTLRFNSDTGANYDWEINEVSGSATNSIGQNFAQTSLHIGYVAAATAPANVADACEAQIADYRGTTFQKVIHSRSAAKTSTSSGGLFLSMFAGFWRSTSAITQIDVILASGTFVSGSVVSLYGIL